MKQLFTLVFFSLIAITSSAADSSFVINGKLSELKSGKIFLNYFYNDKSTFDSAVILNGKFSFKGFVSTPVSANLTLQGKKSDWLSFFIEPAKINITGKGDSLKLLSVSGSIVNDDDRKLKAMMSSVTEWQNRNAKIYDEAYNAKNKAVMDSLDEVDLEIMQETRKVVAEFVKENPNSVRGALSFKQNFSYYAEAVDMEPIYADLGKNIKESKLGMDIKKMIDTYRTVAPGQVAPDIVQTAPDGSTIALSSLKGKYVLVDFWASWCGPCRRENPNVVKIFNDYKSKDFTIYGVSYDTKKERWEKAIKDDGLAWYQVSDLLGWKNSTSEQYGIKAIPSNMILDKEGRIIAKNLFGKKLAAKMAEILP